MDQYEFILLLNTNYLQSTVMKGVAIGQDCGLIHCVQFLCDRCFPRYEPRTDVSVNIQHRLPSRPSLTVLVA